MVEEIFRELKEVRMQLFRSWSLLIFFTLPMQSFRKASSWEGKIEVNIFVYLNCAWILLITFHSFSQASNIIY
jgi:hypothetical protein